MKHLFLIGVLLFSQSIFAQFPLTKELTAKFDLTSKYNKTNYTLEVSLPVNYNANTKYPVYYILDGYYARYNPYETSLAVGQAGIIDIDDVYGREVAHEVIIQSREDYRKNFG